MAHLAAAALTAYAAGSCATTPAEPYNASHELATGRLDYPRVESQDTPESYVLPRPRASRSSNRPRSLTPARSGPSASGDGAAVGVWAALARCESGNTNDHGAPFFGYFQFSSATWRSMGHDGNADDYPYDVQLEAAQRLQARSGWGQWPACSRKLGLR